MNGKVEGAALLAAGEELSGFDERVLRAARAARQARSRGDFASYDRHLRGLLTALAEEDEHRRG